MARRSVITYEVHLGSSGKRQSTSVFYLATCTDLMQFYCFDEPREGCENTWTLINELDRGRLLAAGDKATAKTWAKLLGLKSWRYVRVL
jgi:hypothetical protein